MEKGENYYKRQEYMKELKIPTFTEIRNILGKDLGDAVINECPEVLKRELGTEPKLHGAGDTLWTSPSDLLEGIVVLKPPFTNRYIKALTHKGILSIGAIIEEKFRNEMEEKCRNALVNQEEMLLFIAEQERIKAVRDALVERMKYYDEKFESFENDFEERLQDELELLTIRLLDDNQKVLETQREEIEIEWQERLAAEIEESTANITIRFLEKLDIQEAELTRKYSLELKKIEASHEITLELEQSICKETLKQLKHNLECKNISNLIYVLCMERRKCEYDRIEIESQHNDVVSKLSKQVESSMSGIETLQNALTLAQEKITIKDRCLQEILKQFQKFVYFSLKAAPKQGEFLLNIEKLLLYELAETVENLGKKYAGSPVSIPKRLPPKQKDLIPRDLTLPPDHNCLDEFDHPTDTSEELFSVIFNDKLYVREDFRNMISQGIDMQPTNELWNKDVEELMIRLKTSIENATLGRKPKQNSKSQLTDIDMDAISTVPDQYNSTMNKTDTMMIPCIHTDNVEFCIPNDQTSSRLDHDSRRSSVHFVNNKVQDSQLDHIAIAHAGFQTRQYQEQNLTEFLLHAYEGDETNSFQLAALHKNNSILLCVKDSLEHHRMSLRTGSLRDDIKNEEVDYKVMDGNVAEVPNIQSEYFKPRKINEGLEGKNNVVEVKQSIENQLANLLTEQGILSADEIMRKTPITKLKDVHEPHSITPKERRFSGLSLAQDSLELIKSKALEIEEAKNTFRNAIMTETSPGKLSGQEKLGSYIASTNSKKDRISILEKAIEIETHVHTEYYSPPNEEQTLVFKPLPEIYHTRSILINQDQTWRVYDHDHKSDLKRDKSSEGSSGRQKHDYTTHTQRDNFLKKENVAEITGNEQEIKTCTTAFTTDRIHSLIEMMREDPSLMRIFTACSR